MVVLKCRRCGHTWEYKGTNEYYASCGHCLRKVSVKTERVVLDLPPLNIGIAMTIPIKEVIIHEFTGDVAVPILSTEPPKPIVEDLPKPIIEEKKEEPHAGTFGVKKDG